MKATRWLSLLALALLSGCAWGEIRGVEMPDPGEPVLKVTAVAKGLSHVPDGPRHIRRFKVDGKRLSGGEVFATSTAGLFDGFRFDETGHIFTSAADGVHCINPAGELIGKIKVPEVVANVVWGNGEKRNRLYICGTSSLYATYVKTHGMAYPS